jgi:hypothetical protein
VQVWMENANLIYLIVFVGVFISISFSIVVADFDDGIGSKICLHFSSKDFEIANDYRVIIISVTQMTF